eukprot:5432270-Ditylum_brightwellii.AAC.1
MNTFIQGGKKEGGYWGAQIRRKVGFENKYLKNKKTFYRADTGLPWPQDSTKLEKEEKSTWKHH